MEGMSDKEHKAMMKKMKKKKMMGKMDEAKEAVHKSMKGE